MSNHVHALADRGSTVRNARAQEDSLPPIVQQVTCPHKRCTASAARFGDSSAVGFPLGQDQTIFDTKVPSRACLFRLQFFLFLIPFIITVITRSVPKTHGIASTPSPGSTLYSKLRDRGQPHGSLGQGKVDPHVDALSTSFDKVFGFAYTTTVLSPWLSKDLSKGPVGIASAPVWTDMSVGHFVNVENVTMTDKITDCIVLAIDIALTPLSTTSLPAMASDERTHKIEHFKELLFSWMERRYPPLDHGNCLQVLDQSVQHVQGAPIPT